ncbi:thymidine phosphorylase family protein [Erythrobacter mangrovi]|uniref:Putative thymidine phosphorylase n=1 Tax=Erythrobacter mangrovi TaxID=2739433 RepID=A0A7D4C6N3_9SPHN|nr:thymidine phosphorylase family protein [Erythrobacter mangrovi]QKG72585.1 thymidine phosphorylase family protein [Erythrobacter mangrovi]
MSTDIHSIPLVRAGIDTYRQPVVYMREDCHLCRAEGFNSLTRIEITVRDRTIIALLNVVTSADWLPSDTAALSEAAWERLGTRPGDTGSFRHPEPAHSASIIRGKVYGEKLDKVEFRKIVDDVISYRLSDLDIAAFITACAGQRLDVKETLALTQAMQESGQTLDWGDRLVLDKHCVGGVPGNRTTPIIVAIAAAAGFWIPKTSSRAITSPAGTADTMEVMTPVALGITELRRVVEQEGGCLVWGGGLDLSPADDLLIRIERPLDFDSDGQLVASVLSKKAAAGSNHVLIDMPVGSTAKVRSPKAARSLSNRMSAVARGLGMNLSIHQSDGAAPVGWGIGPALEATDVLSVLRLEAGAPVDLREHSLDLAGMLIDLARPGREGGRRLAEELLDDGRAWAKFLAICEAQGGFHEPGIARFRAEEQATRTGWVTAIDNRRISRIAKLAGAPGRKTAGVRVHKRLGEMVEKGEPLFEIHAETIGELEWASEFARSQAPTYEIGEAP